MDERNPVPVPRRLKRISKERKYKGWTWAVIEVDLARAGIESLKRAG
jgi:hypothetical protein